MCASVGIPVRRYLKYIAHYDERNHVAHSSLPQFEDHIDDQGNIQWSEWRAKFKRAKKGFRSETISKADMKFAKKLLKDWQKLYIDEWSLGQPKLTDRGMKAVQAAQENWRKSQKTAAERKMVPPSSPYKKGKWDHTVPE